MFAVTSLVKNLSKEERFKLAILLSGSFCLVEAIAGYWANSLAVLSDASHLLTDVAGFAIALLAALASKMPATNSFTYGFKQAELLGAIASVALLYMLTSYLVIEAISRSIRWYENKMDEVDGKIVFFISIFGVFVNLILGLVFHDEHGGAFHPAHSHDHDHESGGGCAHHNRDDHDHDHNHKKVSSSYEAISSMSGRCEQGSEHGHDLQHHIEDGHSHHDHGHDNHNGHDNCSSYELYQGAEGGVNGATNHNTTTDINTEAAYAHVLTDLIQSVGVAVGGFLIWMFPTWQIIDPICTLLFSVLVVTSTLPLLKKIGLLVLHAGDDSKYDELQRRLMKIKGSLGVHDLHIWHISGSSIGFSVHIGYDSVVSTSDDLHQMHLAVSQVCRDVGVDHSTVQFFDASDGKACPGVQCKLNDSDGIYQSCA